MELANPRCWSEKLRTRILPHEEGVGPEESGKEQAQTGGRNAELVLKEGSRNGEITAVDVVDEDGECEKEEGDQERSRDAGRLGG